jgi:dTDP-4-dehydrorhamnose 3,5-epimerase-like enzyme
MKDDKQKLWAGLNKDVRALLTTRNYNYNEGSLALRLSRNGVEAGQLAAADRTGPETRAAWIPGVELFARIIHAQRYRGIFGEFARRDEGLLAQIGLWPVQWATARMFANTAKGFHVHPPSIPPGQEAAAWLQKLFAEGQPNYSDRLYEREQWDVIFFVQGRVEMILRDARAGLPPRTMRFFIDGDNHRSNNNVGVVVPPGVAHAIRAEGSEEVIMVYGTSTAFNPEFEGRIASEIETAPLPESWAAFLEQSE